jgi:hypothetical protein
MHQPLPKGVPTFTAPRFYLTARQPLRPGAILLAALLAAASLFVVLYALAHSRVRLKQSPDGASRSASSGPNSPSDDKDDPNQIDTIVLGDPADAPRPARPGEKVSPVHPTVLVHLPRFGEQAGLIPNTPAGRLLYGWLAAFNQASYPALAQALPTAEPTSSIDALMELRHQTGGFNLLSAKEIRPGLLVFRLRDQTPAATEALGTLQLQPNSSPARIATFSLRAIPSPDPRNRPQGP